MRVEKSLKSSAGDSYIQNVFRLKFAKNIEMAFIKIISFPAFNHKNDVWKKGEGTRI